MSIICQLKTNKNTLGCAMPKFVSVTLFRPCMFSFMFCLDKLMYKELAVKTTGQRVTESLKENFTYVFSSSVWQFHVLTYRRQSYFPFFHILRIKSSLLNFLNSSEVYPLLPMPKSPHYFPRIAVMASDFIPQLSGLPCSNPSARWTTKMKT